MQKTIEIPSCHLRNDLILPPPTFVLDAVLFLYQFAIMLLPNVSSAVLRLTIGKLPPCHPTSEPLFCSSVVNDGQEREPYFSSSACDEVLLPASRLLEAG